MTTFKTTTFKPRRPGFGTHQPGSNAWYLEQLELPAGQRAPEFWQYESIPIHLPYNVPQVADLGFKVPKGKKLSITPFKGGEPTFGIFDPATQKTTLPTQLGAPPLLAPPPEEAFSLIKKAGWALPEETPEAATQRLAGMVKTDQDAFLKQMRQAGRTAEGDTLLRQMFSGLTEQDIAKIYLPELPLEQSLLMFDALPSLVTERNIGEMWSYFLDNPDAFRKAMIAEGKNPMTTVLMKSLYPDITDLQIDDFLSLDALMMEKGIKKTGGAFTRGVGQLMENTGGVFKWLGAEGIGDKIARAGQFTVASSIEDNLGEFNWKLLFNPEFYTNRVMGTLPSMMLLAVPGVGAYGLAGSVAGKVGLGAVGRAIITGVGGAVITRPMESAMEAASAYDESRNKGLSHEEAERAADKVFRNNLLLTGLDAGQLAVAFAPVPFKGFGRFVKTAMAGGKLAAIGLTEGGEEVVQDIFIRQALGEKVTLDPDMQQAFVIGTIMGLGMGGGGEIIQRISNRTIAKLTPAQRTQFDTLAAGFKEQMTDDVALTRALDEIGKKPEVKKILEEVTEQVKEEITLEQIKPKDEVDKVAIDHLKKQLVEEGKVSAEAIGLPTPVEAPAAEMPEAPVAKVVAEDIVIVELEKKWSSAKTRNSALAQRDLDKLKKDGYFTGDAQEALDEYKKTVREDFDDAEEFSEARASAWDEFVDSLSGIEKIEEEGIIPAAPEARVVPPEPAITEALPEVEPAVSEVAIPKAEVVEPPAPEVTPPPAPKETPINRLKRIHSELEDDVNIAKKKIKDIKTPLPTQSADVQFARLALNDADKLIRRAETLTKRLEQGQEVSEEEINALTDKLASIKDFYKHEARTTAQVKEELVKYIKGLLPLPRQGELLAKVKNVKTEADLTEAITRVADLAEAQTEKELRSEIVKELKKTEVKVEKGITVGRLTAEIQAVIEKLRADLLVGTGETGQGVAANVEAYETAREQIAKNIAQYQEGNMSWEDMFIANEKQKYTGLFGMSADQLQETLDYLQEMKRLGKDFRKIKLDAIKAEAEDIRVKGIDELTGGQGIKPGVGVLRPEDLAAAKKVLDQPVNSQYGFVNLLDKLGKLKRGTQAFKGYLMRFARAVQNSNNTENMERERSFKVVSEKFKEIYQAPNAREAQRLINKLTNEDIDLGTFKITTTEGVKYLSIKLTKAQMMEVYQLYKNSKNLETFKEGHHWTPEVMTAIVNNLSEQDIAFANWLQDEFYSEYYDKINPVYRDEFNVDMPKNPDYVPQSRDFTAQEDNEVTMLMQDQQRYASVTNKSLKARKRNIRPFKLNGIFNVVTNHIVQMEHFIAWAKTMHELRRFFGNVEVRTATKQYHSGDIVQRIDDYMNDFARGGRDKAHFLSWLDKLRSNFAVSVLAIKPSIGLQQIWTAGAFVTEMKTGDFVSGIAGFFAHPIQNYKWMMENSAYLKARYTSGNYERDIRITQEKTVAQRISGKTKITEYLLWQITQGDKFGVMPGWWAKYQAGLKEGLSQAEAMTEADLTAERTQNTSEIASLAWLQRGSSWGKLITMFQSQPNKYFRLVADNIRNMQYGRQSKVKGITNLFIIWALLPALFQLTADAFQWKKEKQARVLLLGPLNNILVAGQLVQTAWGWFTDDSFDWQASPVLSTVRDFQNFAAKTRKVISQYADPYKDVSVDDVMAAVEFLAKAVGQLTGLPTPYAVQVEKALRGTEGKRDLRELVFSRWALKDEPTEHEKIADELEKLGKPIEPAEGKMSGEKPPPVYDMKKLDGFFRGEFKAKLPEWIIRDKKDHDPLAVAWAEKEISRKVSDTLPDIALSKYSLDATKDDTIIQFYPQWQVRQRLTSLQQIEDFDRLNPKAYLGNVSRIQYDLMTKYLSITDKAEQAKFLANHSELNEVPRVSWLKSHPEENARLAVFGHEKAWTLEAYNLAQKMIKDLDIPEDAVSGFFPPKELAQDYFSLQQVLETRDESSWEAKLIRAKNPELNKWLKYAEVTDSVQELELKVEFRPQFDQLDGFSDKESKFYVKDEEKRKKAREDWFAAPEQSDFRDAQRKIEVYDKKGSDAFANLNVELGKKAFEDGPVSPSVKLFKLENPEFFKWGLDNDLWNDDLSKESIDALRLRVNHKVTLSRYDGMLDKKSKFYVQDETQREKLRKAFRLDPKNKVFNDDLRRIEIHEIGGARPLVVEQYVEYGKVTDKFGSASAEAKLFKIDHPELYSFGMQKMDWTEITDKIPVLRINARWRTQDDQYDELDTASRARFLAANPGYKTARLTRNAYEKDFPDNLIQNYVEYYSMERKGYGNERYLMNHEAFYLMAKHLLDWAPIDFSKIPSERVESLYNQYTGNTALSGRDLTTWRRNFRLQNPDLDEWMKRTGK